MKFCFVIIFTMLLSILQAQNATEEYWHGKERSIRYQPEGNDFVITNGNRRFTRALYGTNTAFRVEAGDIPEFALYLPGMGGNFKLGIVNKDSSKWLIDAAKITARYRAGSMLYTIEDPLLGKDKLQIIVLAMAEEEGMIIKISSGVSLPVELVWVFGGATGKKFNRDGDMGPDPESSFYLQPAYCKDNSYIISNDQFRLKFGTGLTPQSDPYVNKTPTDTIVSLKPGREQELTGIMAGPMHVADAAQQQTPASLFLSGESPAPVVTGKLQLKKGRDYYFAIQKPGTAAIKNYQQLPLVFLKAEAARKKIADRIQVNTPDPYINTLGGVISTAADAIWESPSYMHGAVGWRMRLNGWRGPYAADVLGWHERAESHFKSYAASQVIDPLTGPVIADTALHLARSLEKMGTSVFSNGYISRNPGGDLRPHHYDMNLVYIDALLNHFNWTGDTAFVKEIWPVIKRHLAWEKRNFDSDNDGLYDAYAAIWASDALQYSGGSVTHSSAYNYKANKMAAELALLMKEDPAPYKQEAAKILSTINTFLWMQAKGSYAEYKDRLGLQLLHPQAGLWTIYHSIDSDVPDPFRSYLALRYIDESIPHIPINAKGLEKGYYTISTSNWMPYDWSLNNVAMAESMHTALANWQAGRNEEAFQLWKSELLASMYLGGSPGNIGQISYYDAIRGEAYRDFADPVGVTARTLVEGLFGIKPDLLHNKITIKPGFPLAWEQASIQTPDISMQFWRKDDSNFDYYIIKPGFPKKVSLQLRLKVRGTGVPNITVNDKPAKWKNDSTAVGDPVIIIECGAATQYLISVQWNGERLVNIPLEEFYVKGDKIDLDRGSFELLAINDPQGLLSETRFYKNRISATVTATGYKTVFFQLKIGEFVYWQPLNLLIKDRIEITAPDQQAENNLRFTIVNNSPATISGEVVVNRGTHPFIMPVTLLPFHQYTQFNIGEEHTIAGSNEVVFNWRDSLGNSGVARQCIVNWNVVNHHGNPAVIGLTGLFNDKVTQIFKNQYLSPRPTTPTLQLPTQGIGDWTHPLKTADINDSGLRKLAGELNRIVLPQQIPFTTISDTSKRNIIFTSRWDNYPSEVIVPISGKASHAYLLMAGSTNPMQSRINNGAVIVSYTNGTSDTLLLKNPETWWPIEQDYYDDGYAFNTNAPKPVRIHLKTGKIVTVPNKRNDEYNGKMIDGGAATVLDMVLDAGKTLKDIKLQTWANDVVIGLMAITLMRE